MSDLMPVPFRNATLYLADVDGTPYTPMKPIVEGMGLAWQPQLTKINENKDRWGVTIIVIPTEGGHQDAVCLPLRKLPGWLMTVNPRKVSPEIRATIEAYQAECDDVLWDYWTKGQAINPRTANLPDFSDPAAAARAWAQEYEGRATAERELESARPKALVYDQFLGAPDVRYDWAETFSLLQRKTGQHFTRRTFLDFLRRHGVAKKPNPWTNISADRFVPCADYIGSWFECDIGPRGTKEWLLRPDALAGIVLLIERDRRHHALARV
jgi:hypothetical protein